MKKLKELVLFEAGSPQFRVNPSEDKDAPVYYYYTIDDLRADLYNKESDTTLNDMKKIKTYDEICLTEEDDVILSITNPEASLVRKSHSGFFLTQNFVKVKTSKEIDPLYFIYLMNEDRSIKKQILNFNKSVAIKKTTIKELESLKIEHLPDLDTQKRIGEVYLNQKRLTYLRNKESELSELYVLEKIKGGH